MKGNLSCPECSKPFSTPQGMAGHRRKEHRVKGKNGHTTKHTYRSKGGKQDGLPACPNCGEDLRPYQAIHRMLHP